MSEAKARRILEEYVSAGKLMQVATVSNNQRPAVCHVWYSFQFKPDRLHFISRPDRDHSANIRATGHVAGGIVHIPLVGLGQKVTGVTFKGIASELGPNAVDAREEFLSRWPSARGSITAGSASEDARPASRIYEIDVSEWVLFDEQRFPDAPRLVLSPADSHPST